MSDLKITIKKEDLPKEGSFEYTLLLHWSGALPLVKYYRELRLELLMDSLKKGINEKGS